MRSSKCTWVSSAVMVLTVSISASFLSTSDASVPSPVIYNVGYAVVDIQNQHNCSGKSITVAVWYPTAERPEPYQYGGPTWGNVAPGAKPLSGKGRFPFLAFSHGFGGCGLASTFFTEAFAARRWIVACPDHHDSHSFGGFSSLALCGTIPELHDHRIDVDFSQRDEALIQGRALAQILRTKVLYCEADRPLAKEATVIELILIRSFSNVWI